MQLAYTPNSGFLVTSVLDGKADIALATIDNLVAYQEGQGEAKVADDPDLFAFMGGDGGFLSVVAAPSINSVADLQGQDALRRRDDHRRSLSCCANWSRAAASTEADVNFVRAGGTANRYRDLLAGKQEATLLRTPFELLARDARLSQARDGRIARRVPGHASVSRAEAGRASTRRRSSASSRRTRPATDWLVRPRQPRDRRSAARRQHPRHDAGARASARTTCCCPTRAGSSRDLAPSGGASARCCNCAASTRTPQKKLTDPMKYVDSRVLQQGVRQA